MCLTPGKLILILRFSSTLKIRAETEFRLQRRAHDTGSSRLFQHALLSTVVEPEAEFVLGDVDLSGDVDFDDIGPFIALLSGGFQAEADIDGNGLVNFDDIAGFIGILGGS